MRIKVKESLIKIWRKFFPKKEKVAVVIDGENLYKSLIDLGGLRITNFEEFKKRLLKEGQELTKLPIYCTSVDPRNPRKNLRFFKYLNSQGYEVKSKPLLIEREAKSEIDPLVAACIYRCAAEVDINTIILVSGDRHFIEAVNFAKEQEKKVIVISLAASLSKELEDASDEWIELKYIIEGITEKSEIHEKREQALDKFWRGESINLATLEEAL